MRLDRRRFHVFIILLFTIYTFYSELENQEAHKSEGKIIKIDSIPLWIWEFGLIFEGILQRVWDSSE